MPDPKQSWWSVSTSGWISLVTSAAVGGLVGALVSSVLVPWFLSPPREVTDLITQEASMASLAHPSEADLVDYDRMFDQDAVVVDVQAPPANGTWHGTSEILNRYRHLQDGPIRVVSVRHELLGDAKWLSDGTILAVTMSAVELENVGVKEPHEGLEVWKFKKDLGHWKIASFRFNIGQSSALLR